MKQQMNMKYIQNVLVLLVTCLLVLPGCWPGKKTQEVGKQSLYVLNILDKQWHNDCHIAGSINVPFAELEEFVRDKDKDTEIVVYCSNYQCVASEQAYKILTKMGFTNVWAYEGGIAQWFQMGYPVSGACKKPYLQKVLEKPEMPEDKSEMRTKVRTIEAAELKAKMAAHTA